MSCSLLLTVISWVTDAAAMHDIAHLTSAVFPMCGILMVSCIWPKYPA
jgi:hypothetical protein